MSWYEATAFDSISLARSLIEKDALTEFDNVLKENGLAKLCREDSVKATQTNRDEAIEELEWVKSFLQNVMKRPVQPGTTIKKRKLDVEKTNGASKTEDLEVTTQATNPKENIPEVAAAEAAKPQTSSQKTTIASPHQEHIGQKTPMNWKQRMVERNSQRERAERVSIRQKASDSQPKPTSRSRTRPVPLPSRQTVPIPPPSPVPTRAPPAEIWCICRGVSAGLMIACDNEACPYEWFHASCVKLSDVPSTTWYCPVCRPKMLRIERASRRKRK